MLWNADKELKFFEYVTKTRTEEHHYRGDKTGTDLADMDFEQGWENL